MNKFIKLYKCMFSMEGLQGNYGAIILYSAMLDLHQLSKKNLDKYKDNIGIFIIYDAKKAEDELGMSRRTYFRHKALLKDIGLINYQEQVSKKSGVSTPIYVNEIENLNEEVQF